eukprot:gene12060-14250_t
MPVGSDRGVSKGNGLHASLAVIAVSVWRDGPHASLAVIAVSVWRDGPHVSLAVIAVWVADACKSGDQVMRSGARIADAASIETSICGAEQYSGQGTVMCGGHVPVVCSSGHFRRSTQDKCATCPAISMLLVLGAISLLLHLALVVLLMWVFGSGGRAKQPPDIQNVTGASTPLVDTTQDMAIQITKLNGMLSLMLGYFQVMSQLNLVYDPASMPPHFGHFLRHFDVFTLDLALFNSKCMLDYWISKRSVDLGFWCDFYLTQASPLIMLAGFGILAIRYHFRRRARSCSYRDLLTLEKWKAIFDPEIPKDEGALKQQADEMEVWLDYQATCTAATIFVLMLLHPTLSTSSLMIFKCKDYYYDSADYDSHQQWLYMNVRVECYSADWTIGASIAAFSLLTFTFGFPLYIYGRMRNLSSFVQVRMDRANIEQHSDLLKSRRWKLFQQSDILRFRRDGHFEAWEEMYDDTRPNKTGCFVSLNPLCLTNIKENDGPLMLTCDHNPSLRPSVGHVPRIDLVMHASTMHGLEEALAKDSSLVSGDDGSGLQTCPVSIMLVHDGSCLEMDAYVQYQQDAGRTQLKCMTLLDQPSFSKAFRQLYMPYVHALYFWHCYEICRRVAQTSAVVVVDLILNTSVSHLYAVIFAFCAVCLHLTYSPFKDTGLQHLQTLILCNQFLVQLGMSFYFWNTKNDDTQHYTDLVLLGLQLMLICYSLAVIVPATMRLVSGILTQAHGIYLTRFSWLGSENPAEITQDPVHVQSTVPSFHDVQMTSNHLIGENFESEECHVTLNDGVEEDVDIKDVR